MRVADRIPVGSARNADMFGSSKLKKGERVVDLALDIEDMPIRGKLVIKESNVVRMAKALKLGIRTQAEEEALQAELEELRTLAAEHAHLKEILSNV